MKNAHSNEKEGFASEQMYYKCKMNQLSTPYITSSSAPEISSLVTLRTARTTRWQQRILRTPIQTNAGQMFGSHQQRSA